MAPVLRVLRVLLGVVVVVVSGDSLICLHVTCGSISCFKYQEILHFPCYKRDITVRVNKTLWCPEGQQYLNRYIAKYFPAMHPYKLTVLFITNMYYIDSYLPFLINIK